MELLFIIVVCFLVAGAICYLLSYSGGDFVRLGLFFLSPVVVYILGSISLNYIWDPNPGCTYDCLGRVAYLVGGAAAIAGAEVGTLVGWFNAWLETRGPRD